MSSAIGPQGGGVSQHRTVWPGAALLWPGGLLLAMLLALGVGRYPVALADIVHYLLATLGLAELPPERARLLHNLLVQIRLPRVLAAVLVGAGLSVSGAAYQAVFRNPLVSPGLLGVLAGAGFGAALGILLALPWWAVQALSFAMGVGAVALGVAVGRWVGGGGLIMLVLGGLLSAALFSSLLSLVKYAADPYNQLPTIVYWLMGSLGQVDLGRLTGFALPMAGGTLLLCGAGRALDGLALGEDEALSLGLPVRRLRLGVIAAATAVSALTVALVGMVGWVGLIVPHVCRTLVGPGNARLMPASACAGGIFLLGADALARSVAVAEIPIGIVTELAGIPVFLLVLRRARGAWA